MSEAVAVLTNTRNFPDKIKIKKLQENTKCLI